MFLIHNLVSWLGSAMRPRVFCISHKPIHRPCLTKGKWFQLIITLWSKVFSELKFLTGLNLWLYVIWTFTFPYLFCVLGMLIRPLSLTSDYLQAYWSCTRMWELASTRTCMCYGSYWRTVNQVDQAQLLLGGKSHILEKYLIGQGAVHCAAAVIDYATCPVSYPWFHAYCK